MIEILATDVQHEHQAQRLLQIIKDIFPGYRANFDLDDCDHILRIVTDEDALDTVAIIGLLEARGFRATVLPDHVASATLTIQS